MPVTHLVHVHVGLSAGTCLIDDEGEVVDELSADDLGEEMRGCALVNDLIHCTLSSGAFLRHYRRMIE